jgi:polyadenylate-binding protein
MPGMMPPQMMYRGAPFMGAMPGMPPQFYQQQQQMMQQQYMMMQRQMQQRQMQYGRGTPPQYPGAYTPPGAMHPTMPGMGSPTQTASAASPSTPVSGALSGAAPPSPGSAGPMAAHQGSPSAGPSSPASSVTSHSVSAGSVPSTPMQINTQYLATLPVAEQKQMLGEALFPQIQALDEANAGKITGMLLELDLNELLRLLEVPRELQDKVNEAKQVLAEAQAHGQVDQ